MRCIKSSSKREVYGNTILPQETRKIPNKQPNLIPKATRERKQTKPKISRRKEIIRFRAAINEIEIKKTIEKINETKGWLFEKINKIVRLLDKLINKKQKERVQINTIRNEKGEVIIDTTEIQRIIRDYYKQLYANRKPRRHKFFEKYNLPNLNQDKIESMNRPITSCDIKTD